MIFAVETSLVNNVWYGL